MLRKKSIPSFSSPSRKGHDHPTPSPTALNIDTPIEDTNIVELRPPSPDSTSSSSSQSNSTNLPLLTAAYLSALTTGATTYAFSFYSSALKSSLHLSQSQLDTLGSATFCAGIFSWLPGLIVDGLGPKVGILSGGIGNMCVLSLYWGIATGMLDVGGEETSSTRLIVILSVLGVLTFMGCALITGSVFKLIVESCGEGSKGKAVGCAKGYVGVGSGVYVCLFGAFFGGSTSGKGGTGMDLSMTLTALLPKFDLWSMSAFDAVSSPSIRSTATAVSLTAGSAQPPEVNTLNFLLMASCLSFLAAVLPAILFLPKQSTQQTKPRDGTRSIHFRVIYAGLILMGTWVVVTSLAQLSEEGATNTAGEHPSGSALSMPIAIMIETLVELGPERQSTTNGHVDHHLEWDEVLVSDHYLPQSQHRRQSDKANKKDLVADQSTHPERHWGTALLLLFLWWGPALSLLVIPPRKDGSDGGYTSLDDDDCYDDGVAVDDDATDTGITERGTLLSVDTGSNLRSLSLDKKEENDNDKSNPFVRKDFTLIEMLLTGRAWLMAWTFVVLVGGGTLMTCNIGQMTEALGFDPDVTPASLALFSAAQGASRVITGSISESALSWNIPWCCCGRGVARPIFLVIASLVSVIAHLTLAVASTQRGFAFGVTLSGVAFGMAWPLMVLITGEVFGTLHVGANYLFFDGFSSAVGTLILSKFVAQTVYNQHMIESHGDSADGGHQCFGKGCFQMSHLVVCLLSLTCVLSGIGLTRATRAVYQRS